MQATKAITINLMPATSGLLAEVDHLPVQVGPIYVRNNRLVEAAIDALHGEYPKLVVKGQAVDSETRVVLWCEAV